MVFSPHTFEVLAVERQVSLLVEAGRARKAAAARKEAPARPSALAPVLDWLGTVLISAGEGMRRAASL